MLNYDVLITYILTSIIVCLIPGPAIIYVVSKTLSKGLSTGFKAIWGLQFGFMLQVVAASSGLSALILKSAILFSVLKYLGAIYLIYLGLNILLRKETEVAQTEQKLVKKQTSPFYQGLLINLLNPKISVFFISYVPQFITNHSGSQVKQLFLLGFIFCIIGTFTTIGYAMSSKMVSKKIKTINFGPLIKRWLPGTMFLGFGLKLATAEK